MNLVEFSNRSKRQVKTNILVNEFFHLVSLQFFRVFISFTV